MKQEATHLRLVYDTSENDDGLIQMSCADLELLAVKSGIAANKDEVTMSRWISAQYSPYEPGLKYVERKIMKTRFHVV